MSAKACGIGLVLVLLVPAYGQDGPGAGSGELPVFPVPAGTVFQRHEVFLGEGAPGGTTAGPGGLVLMYSNTLGADGIPLGPFLGTDDIATVFTHNCRMRKFEFPVLGRVDPALGGGPYTVSWSFYRNCPQAVPSHERNSLKINGTVGSLSFPDDAPRTISVNLGGAGVAMPTNVWFGVSFNRANAGVVGGTLPTTGMSCDQFDYQGSVRCGSGLGGYPNYSMASFNLQMWADAGTCRDAFVGYKNNRPSGSILNPGYDVYLIDDLELGVETCEMIAYEVALLGQGFYTMEMRNGCETPPIPGTQKFFGNNNDTVVQTARFAFDPPITLPRDIFFAGTVNNSTGSYIVTGQQACVGATLDYFDVQTGGICNPVPAGLGIHAGLNLTITCAGRPPVGGCCDMIGLQCQGGPDDGKPCCPEGMEVRPYCLAEPTLHDSYPPCASPGSCETVCRELPEMNCPWPPRFSALQPTWVEGATCGSGPFLHTCGVAACCRPDYGCENLNATQCLAVEPVEEPRLWQRGRYCGFDGQRCPAIACLGPAGDCSFPHNDGGCHDSYCCSYVCDVDSYCCQVEWDRSCVDLTAELCDTFMEHDYCWLGGPLFDALPVQPGSRTYFSNMRATEEATDPWFACVFQAPAARGYGTVWFKFVASHTSATVSTSYSDPSGDSLVQVFTPLDNSSEQAACSTLVSIACGDNVRGCPVNSNHARFCVRNLVPGQTYYVMVASKTVLDKGVHELEILSPCTAGTDDCDADGILDACEADCNVNDFPDDCEVALGRALDCNKNGVPDECDPDCNGNNAPDDCDVTTGFSEDCDEDGLPDECLTDRFELKPEGRHGAFGSVVALDGDLAVVGDPNTEFGQNWRRGAVHVFRRNGLFWTQDTTWTSPTDVSDDGFGQSVAVTGDWVLASAPYEDVGTVVDAGVVYAFHREGGTWGAPGRLTSSEPIAGHHFGSTLAASGSYALVGSIHASPPPAYCERGADVSVLTGNRHGWREISRIADPAPQWCGLFGSALALDDEHLVIGSLVQGDSGPYNEALVHVFGRGDGDFWRLESTLHAPSTWGSDCFGRAVAIEGDLIVVGAANASLETYACGTDVNVFRRTDSPSGSPWVHEGRLPVADDDSSGSFGGPVSIKGGRVAVPTSYPQTYQPIGYLFERVDGSWTNTVSWFDKTRVVTQDDLFLVAGGPTEVLIASPKWDRAQESIVGFAEIRPLEAIDCNGNRTPDPCDLHAGTSPDCNGDGTLDECQSLPPAADIDFDGDTDLRDLAAFLRCYTGPGKTTLRPCCGVFDTTPDSAVDGLDFRGFSALFEGP